MVQGGAELVLLEAPHPWGLWSFVMRNPYLGSGNGYSPSFPVEWEGPRGPQGQDVWMIWAANFAGCGKPLLVPADLCQGAYGMNLRRMHFTLAGTAGLLPSPWHDQNVGFASPGKANFSDGTFTITGNGNLALHNDPFGQYQDHFYHDAFHYVFQHINGYGELTAQLQAWGPGANSQVGSKASTGLMLRESDFVIGQTSGRLRGRRLSLGNTFSEAARYGYLGVFKDGSAFFQWRDAGKVRRAPILPHDCSAGCRLRIVRHNNSVEASISAAHGSWQEVGSRTFSSPISRTVTLGIVATSDSPSTFPHYGSYHGRFDDVRLHSEP